MFLHLFCSFYIVIVVFGVNGSYIHFSDDESDQYFLSNSVYDNVNDDVQFPWSNENTEPPSLAYINELFEEQFTGSITHEHGLFATIPNSKDDLWNNLCDQTWHNKGKKDFRDIKCEGEKKPSSVIRPTIWMPKGFTLRSDHIKCSCPKSQTGQYYIPLTNSNHHFLVVPQNDTNYFTLIYVRSTTAIIHGYVQNIQFPFTETFNTTRKCYYTEEALKLYDS